MLPNESVGIVAYGSLIHDPGPEIGPRIIRREKIHTPFPVEFARLSRSRGGAPTVAPHLRGSPVVAELLVLNKDIDLSEVKNLLWRRETRQEDIKRQYRESEHRNAVLVREWRSFPEVRCAIYTDFNPSGKIEKPDPIALAKAAIVSVGMARDGQDGISYLIGLLKAGIETPLMSAYIAELLESTKASSLEGSLARLREMNDSQPAARSDS
jgi:hypothetical protein